MRARLIILALAFTVGGCASLGMGEAPFTINSVVDHGACVMTTDSDKNDYVEERELDRMVEALAAEKITFPKGFVFPASLTDEEVAMFLIHFCHLSFHLLYFD